MVVTEPGQLLMRRIDTLFEHLESGATASVRLAHLDSAGIDPQKVYRATTPSQLRALSAMTDATSFSMAARNLGLSPASVQKAASEMQLHSGIKLFNTNRGGTGMTPSGRAIARFANLALNEWDQAVSEIKAWQGRDTGAIVIASLPLARNFILPTAINAFCKKHPNVQIQVVDGPYSKLLHSLRHGEVDLIIGALRDPAPPGDIAQEPFIAPPLVVMARADHPLHDKPGAITSHDLASYPWVIPGRGTPTRSQFEALFAPGAGVPDPRIVETSSVMLIRALLLDSDRLTLISPYQFFRETKLGLLKNLAVDLPDTARPIGVTTRKSWHPTDIQVDLVDILRDSSHLTP